MTRLYTADWHLGHEKVAQLRGFDRVEDHDAWVRRIIASAILGCGDETHLWVLGDLCLSDFESHCYEFLESLGCYVHIIVGNHDAAHPMHRNSHQHAITWGEVAASIDMAKRLKIGKRDFLLSHFPYVGDHTETDRHMQWRLPDLGLPLVHGHVHAEWVRNGPMLNVGIDAGRVFTDEDVLSLIADMEVTQ